MQNFLAVDKFAGAMVLVALVWTMGTALTLSSAGVFEGIAVAADNAASPAPGAKANPCAAKTKGGNPCAAKEKEKKSNPCAAKSNPCAAKVNPCAAKAKSNPCAAKKN